MKRSAIVFCTLLFPILFAAASDAPDHALQSAEDHDILAPRSSKDFRYSRFLEAEPENPAASENSKRFIPNEQNYCKLLYNLQKSPSGDWILSIKQQPGLACAVLLSPSLYTAAGQTAYALRSIGCINTNDSRIQWGNELLGSVDNMYFLASSAYITDPQLGRVLQIRIPQKAYYGYRDSVTGVREYFLDGSNGFNGSDATTVRLRLYTRPHAESGATHSTYIVPLTANIARAL